MSTYVDNTLKVFRTIFYNPELSLRQIAKKLGVSPTVVSRIAKKLYFDRVLDLKPIGRSYLVGVNSNDLSRSLLIASEALFTFFKLKEQKEIREIRKKEEIVLVFGSRASDYFTDFSDVDVFSGKKKELEKLIKQPIGRAIMKKHIILKGFEPFVEVAFKWRSLYGVSR